MALSRIRWGGLAAVLAGGLSLLMSIFSHPARPEHSPLMTLVGLLFLIGWAGMLTHAAGRSGPLSKMGIGLGMIVASLWMIGFSLRFLAGGLLTLPSPQSSFYAMLLTFYAEYGVLLALMLLGAGALRTNTLPRWLALTVLIVPALDIVVWRYLSLWPALPPLLFGIPWIALGLYLLWLRESRIAPTGT